MKIDRKPPVLAITIESHEEFELLDSDDLLNRLGADCPTCRIDCGGLGDGLLRSNELSRLVDVHKTLVGRGRSLVISGLTDANRKVMSITRLDQMLMLA
jgi:hypothetical protein